MIVILTNAQDATTDFLEHRLAARGADWVRINTENLGSASIEFRASALGASGTLQAGSRAVSTEEITAVYYRRPVMPEVPGHHLPGMRQWMQNEIRRVWGGALMMVPPMRWMNPPLAVSGASYKPEQLARAVRFGLRIPETLIATCPQSAAEFCQRHEWDVIVKPIGHGDISGDGEDPGYVVYTNRLDRSHTSSLATVRNCPTLFQQHIPKTVDVRVTVAGDACIAIAIHSQDVEANRIDCRRSNMRNLRYSVIELSSSLREALLALTRSYGLLYGALDLVMDKQGDYWFLELNPAGQWAWLEQATGAPLADAIIDGLLGAKS